MQSHAIKLWRMLLCTSIAIGMLWLPGTLLAAGCPVVQHHAPTEADTSYLAGDFAKAEGLYQAALAKSPGDPALANGLVHSLLRQQRLMDAASAVQSLIGDKSAPAALLTLRGEVELSQGEPWTASDTAGASAKLDPCNPRTVFLIARLAGLTSRYATERRLLAGAHQMDPDDPEIRAAWMRILPVAQRISETEAYLASPRGESEQALGELRTELEQLKKWASEPRKVCTLVSKSDHAEIPFSAIRTSRGQISGPALDVTVNGHMARLSIDTGYNAHFPIEGFSGLLILHSAAEHMNLKPLFDTQVPGIGAQGPRKGYVALADTISVGGVEYHDCAVQVMDSAFWNDADGSFSPILFSNSLVTLDYPAQKLILDPLPVKPGNTPAGGPEDRYLAPEMKDYMPIYRSGSDLMLPGSINGKRTMLFVLDTAISDSVLSPIAAHEIDKGRRDSKYEMREGNGKVDTSFSPGNVVLSFANFSRNIDRAHTFNTSMFSKDAGMDISGLIGNMTLQGLTMRIDYRDGLVKLIYDPKKAGAFSH